MKIIWLGHAGFRIEIEDAVLLVDPWLEGNPMFPETPGRGDRRRDPCLVTHGHGDHATDAPAICEGTRHPVRATMICQRCGRTRRRDHRLQQGRHGWTNGAG